jgi:PAS domain S-box-containing protein
VNKSLAIDAFESFREVFLLIGPDGRCLFWNKALNEVTGYGDDEIKAIPATDFFPRDDALRIEGAMNAVFASGEHQRVETEVITKDARRIPHELSLTLVKDAGGKPVAVAGLGADITDRKRAEDVLRNMVRETNMRREEITALLESTRLVLERKDFLDAGREILRLSRNLVGAGSGYVALFEGDASSVVLVEPESLREHIGLAGPMPVAALHGKDFVLGKAVIENDLASSPLAERLPESHFAVKNIMLSPLMVDRVPVGLIGLANKPGGFNRRDSLMASAFGEIASLALQNARNLEMLAASEERYREIFQNATEGIFQSAGDQFISVNPSFARMFGFSSAEEMMSEVSVGDIYAHAAERDRVMRLVDERGRVRGVEAQGKRRDGELIWCSLNSHAVTDEDGDTLYYEGTVRDITERKEAEEALRLSEARYRLLIDTAPDIIYTIDASGTLTDINEAFETVTGFSRDEWLGKPFAPLVHPDDLHRAIETFEQARQGGSPAPYELRILTSEGGYRTGEFISKPLIEEGEPVSEFGVARDITERKQAEEELRLAKEQLDATVDALPDLLFEVDSAGRIYEYRAPRANILYAAPEEFIGKTVSEVLPAEAAEVIMEAVGEAARTGRHSGAVYSLDLPTGTSWFELSIASKGDADSPGSRLVALVRDITDRKKAEEEHGIIIKTAMEGFYINDLSGNFVEANDAYCEILGYSLDEFLGMKISDIDVIESPEDVEARIQKIIATGQDHFEARHQRKDGRIIDVEASVTFRDVEGGRIYSFIRDITKRKKTEHDLQVLNNELEGYAHTVSHDLKGPLASIGAASDTILSLLTRDLDADGIGGVREMSAIIANNVEKSTALIEGLLELAEAGQRPHDATDVDVAEVVDGIVAERREEIKARHIKVHTHRDLGRIKASPTHMYQLFSNLIDNAIKHNTSRKPTVDVEYIGRDRAGGHQFVVRDNGPGIDPAEARTVFLPFVAGAGGKTGIGLAIVEKIVGVYGGTIEVSNDGGARFAFVLFDVI